MCSFHSPRGRPPKELDPTAEPAVRLAAEVRRRRSQLGLTQAEVAELIGCGRSTFAQLEEAEGEPSFSLLAACDVVLGAGGAIAIFFPSVLIGAAIHRDHQAQARRAAEGLPTWPAKPPSCDMLRITSFSVDSGQSPTNRRHALRYTLGAPLVVAGVDWSAFFGPDWFPTPSERLAKAVDQPRRLDAAVLDELAATNARNERLDDQLGARALLGPVMAHLALVRELSSGSAPLELRPRLTSIMADATRMAGFVWRDQQQFGATESYYRQATEIAREAGDTLLEAYIVGNRSRMLIERGDAAQALVVVDGARRLMAKGASPKMHAYVAATEAQALSTVGLSDASLRAIDHADSWLERADPAEDLAYLYWLGQANLNAWKGGSYLRVGRLNEAEAVITNALSTLDSTFVRDRAAALVFLATVRTRQEEVDEASNLLGQALKLTTETDSLRVLQRIYDLRTEVEPWSTTPAVKALDEQLVAT